jgi:hypothetical protein
MLGFFVYVFHYPIADWQGATVPGDISVKKISKCISMGLEMYRRFRVSYDYYFIAFSFHNQTYLFQLVHDDYQFFRSCQILFAVQKINNSNIPFCLTSSAYLVQKFSLRSSVSCREVINNDILYAII